MKYSLASSLFIVYFFLCFYIVCIIVNCQIDVGGISNIPTSSSNWKILTSSTINLFTGRNSHASCVFKDKLWIIGGRTDAYVKYNFQDSYSTADIWYSGDGINWYQVIEIYGDYFAQNIDVVQPGPIAPFYERFGHSLDAIDIDNDGNEDFMILMGGFSPQPSNDIWISRDGIHWIFCDDITPWSPRAWHSTSIYNGKLFMFGGSPLNNEVWYLDSIEQKHRLDPLTRSMFTNYTYHLVWKQMPNAPWSPRAGFVSLSYTNINISSNITMENSNGSYNQHLYVIGGFGGWSSNPFYDGFYCTNDVWMTTNGSFWIQLTSNATFGPRAWFDAKVLNNYMFLVGGGNTGFNTRSNKQIIFMEGYPDIYRSTDGIAWTRINYEDGGGITTLPKYSSQEWTSMQLNGKLSFLGKWGHSLEVLKTSVR